jgi:hypothetical protein
MRAAEYQLEKLKDPEFIEKKTEEDEKFKEQSFGACVSVVAVVFVVFCLSCVFIFVAAREKTHRQKLAFAQMPVSPTGNITNLLPLTLGDLQRQQVGEISQPDTSTPIIHAKYGDHILIYALPLSNSTRESLSSFRLAISAIDNQTTPPLVSQEVRGKLGYYAIIGADGGLVGDVAQRLVNGKV